MPYGDVLPLSLEYNPTPFGLTRINILIGENGVGKTEILRFLHSNKNKQGNDILVFEFTTPNSSTEQQPDSPPPLSEKTERSHHNLAAFSDIILLESALDEIEPLQKKIRKI